MSALSNSISNRFRRDCEMLDEAFFDRDAEQWASENYVTSKMRQGYRFVEKREGLAPEDSFHMLLLLRAIERQLDKELDPAGWANALRAIERTNDFFVAMNRQGGLQAPALDVYFREELKTQLSLAGYNADCPCAADEQDRQPQLGRTLDAGAQYFAIGAYRHHQNWFADAQGDIPIPDPIDSIHSLLAAAVNQRI